MEKPNREEKFQPQNPEDPPQQQQLPFIDEKKWRSQFWSRLHHSITRHDDDSCQEILPSPSPPHHTIPLRSTVSSLQNNCCMPRSKTKFFFLSLHFHVPPPVGIDLKWKTHIGADAHRWCKIIWWLKLSGGLGVRVQRATLCVLKVCVCLGQLRFKVG